MRFAVIMAGGSGERFWPLSRKLRPKQLLRLTDPDVTMLEEAVNRIAPLLGRDNVFIATSAHLAAPIRKAAIVAPENVLAEPDKRNTLGCLAWVAASILARYGETGRHATLSILTADHKIDDPDQFRDDHTLAITIAEETDSLVTLGIKPNRPDTGFGYIEFGEQVDSHTSRVKMFREKPDLATAKSFLEQGNFLWNSGMFTWKVSTFCDELAAVDPASAALVLSMAEALEKAHEDHAITLFRQLPNISIDYALMEKSSKVFCVRASFPWDDVGSFDSLLRTMPLDEQGNVSIGHVVAKDCSGCVLYNDTEDRVLTAVGLRDMILVQTGDAVLMAAISDAQRVKEIVQMLGFSSYL